MALRPLRNAMITFGLVNIPVRMYTATKSEDVHFNLLHKNCGSRVNRKWWCPQHDEAMKKQNKVAVARWVSGGREHLVILRPYENGLVLHTMFYADEVRDFGVIDMEEAQPRDKEIALAEMLINELSEKKFDPLAYKDAYRDRLLDRIKAKAEGETIVSAASDEARAGEVIDIMEALRRSLDAGGATKAPKRPKRAVRAAEAPSKARKRKAS